MPSADQRDRALADSTSRAGIMDAEGNELSPNKSIRVALADGQEVFVLLQADEEDTAAIKGARAPPTLRMQGAAPAKCIISGPGVTYGLVNQAASFTLQARDTYGNLTSNGGEKFEVTVSWPDSISQKDRDKGAEKDPPATITDRGDGSYLVSHCMTRKGRYDVKVELDGEPLAVARSDAVR